MLIIRDDVMYDLCTSTFIFYTFDFSMKCVWLMWITWWNLQTWHGITRTLSTLATWAMFEHHLKHVMPSADWKERCERISIIKPLTRICLDWESIERAALSAYHCKRANFIHLSLLLLFWYDAIEVYQIYTLTFLLYFFRIAIIGFSIILTLFSSFVSHGWNAHHLFDLDIHLYFDTTKPKLNTGLSRTAASCYPSSISQYPCWAVRHDPLQQKMSPEQCVWMQNDSCQVQTSKRWRDVLVGVDWNGSTMMISWH